MGGPLGDREKRSQYWCGARRVEADLVYERGALHGAAEEERAGQQADATD